MKTLLTLVSMTLAPRDATDGSNIDAANAHVEGANIGWINAHNDVTNGAEVSIFPMGPPSRRSSAVSPTARISAG